MTQNEKNLYLIIAALFTYMWFDHCAIWKQIVEINELQTLAVGAFAELWQHCVKAGI